MYKFLPFLLVMGLLQACGPKIELPEGAPAYIKTNALIKAAKERSLNFNTLSIKGSGRFEEAGKSQSFRFEIRMAKDSLIWVDLADPFLGLKVARGRLSKTELSYYNRLERNYRQGSSEKLAEQMGLSFDFEPMMAILSASFLDWNQNWYQDLVPGKHQLVNYPLEVNQAPPAPNMPLISQGIEANSYRPIDFRIRRNQVGQNISIELLNYQDFEGTDFPSQVNFHYQENQRDIKIELKINSLKLDEALSYPFRIPSSYEKL